MHPIRTFAILVTAVAMHAAGANSFRAMRQQFADPPAEYSTAPFYVWNGEVTESDIDRTLADYRSKGIKSLIVHPRPGLITPYLSDRWFALMRYAVDKGKAQGMQVWLYDENSYPSGFAGGHVPATMPESWNQGQGLTLVEMKSVAPETAGRCTLLLKEADGAVRDVTGSPADRSGAGRYYCFELAFYPKRGWNAGFSYVDLIRPGVTEKFIDITMRGYERSIGPEFGRTVPGIFTDEPNIIAPAGKRCIRWTPDLFEQFRKRWGYPLETSLLSLFEERGDWRKVRHNYQELLLELFIGRWSKPWFKYTEEKKLQWTGHYWEHGWPSPQHGPDNMAMYAWHQTPSIDLLFNRFAEDANAQFGNVRAVKELASVANQMGRRRTLSETYGGSGWELRFEDMKRLGDWEYALGVNLMNQHLTYQTALGARKYDWPQSFSYHTPWWPHYRVLADYFARLSLALSSGEQVNRILVLEPTTSAWQYYSYGQPDKRLLALGEAFQSFVTRLESLQGEYDLGCENILKDRAKVEGSTLVVGRRKYDLVVLPPGVENLDSPVVQLLGAYLEAGGRVLSFVEPPPLVDGMNSNAMRGLSIRYRSGWQRAGSLDEPGVRAQLLPAGFGPFEGKVFHHRRKLEDGELIFLVNTSLEDRARGEFLASARSLTRLDLLTGRTEPYPGAMRDGKIAVSFDLPPAGSLLLFAGTDGRLAPVPPKPAPPATAVSLAGPISVKRAKPNVLKIDYCDLKLDGKTIENQYFWRAADAVFRHHGFAEGDPWSTAVQFKSSTLDRDKFPAGSGFEAAFHFEVHSAVARQGIKAVVERPGIFKVAVNGERVQARPGEWWLDRDFGVYEIGPLVRAGRNTITLSVNPMSVHAELEPVYILGEFGVEPQPAGWKIVPPEPAKLGSWRQQALPFYSDWMEYSGTFQGKAGVPCLVRLPKWAGTVAEVRVNGKPAGIIGWQPYEIDVTRLVASGSNRVEVRICGSLKNLFGPHHGKPGRGFSPPQAVRNGPQQPPPGAGYDLDDYGLMTPFEILAR